MNVKISLLIQRGNFYSQSALLIYFVVFEGFIILVPTSMTKEAKSKDDDSGNFPGTGGNSGTMIVDATCAPSNIRYPQDVAFSARYFFNSGSTISASSLLE